MTATHNVQVEFDRENLRRVYVTVYRELFFNPHPRPLTEPDRVAMNQALRDTMRACVDEFIEVTC